MSKETSVWIKRDLYQTSTNTWVLDSARRTAEKRQIWRQICQKRPLYKQKETTVLFIQTYTRDLQRDMRFGRDAQLGSDASNMAPNVSKENSIRYRIYVLKGDLCRTWDSWHRAIFPAYHSRLLDRALLQKRPIILRSLLIVTSRPFSRLP